MELRIEREPCMLYETVELLYALSMTSRRNG